MVLLDTCICMYIYSTYINAIFNNCMYVCMYICRHRPQWGITQTFVEMKERHDLDQVKTALHDMYLLSMCDRGAYIRFPIVCIYVCVYVCMYVCIYVRMYVCMYVCMYVFSISGRKPYSVVCM